MVVKFLTSLSIALGLGIVACSPVPGILHGGDAPPTNGTLLYQGGLISTSSISGGAKVYLANGRITLYLENYSALIGTQYTVILSTGTTPDFYHTVLKASVGSQSYPTGLSNPGSPFTQVLICLNASTILTPLATAYLSSVLPFTATVKF